MTIGTSNRTKLSWVKETVPGTTPATPTMQLMRYTGETLNSSNTTTESEEIRDDRATSDLALVDQSNSGDINGELSGATFDEFLEAALFSDAWSSVDNGGETTIAATASGFTDSGSGFVTAGLEVGQFINISGFSNSDIDGYYRVTSLAAGTIETYPVPPATEAASASVTYIGSTIKSSNVDHSYTIQKTFSDVSPVVYNNFRGCRVSTMAMNFSIGSIATINFGIIGMTSEVTETQISGLTETAKTTTSVMNAVSNVTNIIAVGDSITSTLKFTELSLNYDNALRELKEIGLLGTSEVRSGTINATATLNPYFETKELLDAFLANDSFFLSWQVTSSDGYVYIYSLPNVKFVSQTLTAGSRDADMIIQGDVRAILDPSSLTTMRVDRFTP